MDPKAAQEANDAMFGGHIPEEPAPAREGGGDFGVKLNPEKMPEALKDGTANEAAITRAAGRVLYEIVHFGYLDGQSKHDVTAQAIDANAAIIEKTGEDAAVLLKNDGGVLPLKASELDSVVLIGPTAGQVDSIGINGERSVGLPSRQVGPLAAMKKVSGNSAIGFAVNDDMTGTTIPASALSHDGKPGLVRTGAGAAQTDPQLDFTVKNGNALPANLVVTWKGTLTVPHDGNYWLYLQALGTNAQISLDGKRLAATGAFQGGVHGDILQANQDNAIPTTDGLDNVRRAVNLTAGPHAIEITTGTDTSNAPVQVRLNWYPPEQRKADHEAAIAAAKNAKVAVVFLWTRLEPVFGLPGEQNKLVEEIAAVNPNTVVVLNTSQPIALPWVDKVKSVLEMWWPGDEGGWSTANLLLGKTSPAGRLPVTWGKSLEDYPATNPKYPERSLKGVDGKTTYSEGVNVGYRWFDKENVEPLFAFGHGLSYTTFDYSRLKVEEPRMEDSTCASISRTPGAPTQTKCRRFISGRRVRFRRACSSLFGLSSRSTGFTSLQVNRRLWSCTCLRASCSIGLRQKRSGCGPMANETSAWADPRATCVSANRSTSKTLAASRRLNSGQAPHRTCPGSIFRKESLANCG
jgi:beta-glucosidase